MPRAEDTFGVLCRMTDQIRSITRMVSTGEALPEALLTASELARCLGINHETVKKQLKWLKTQGLVQALGMNPKCYQFDTYTYRRLQGQDHTDPLLVDLLAYLDRSTREN